MSIASYQHRPSVGRKLLGWTTLVVSATCLLANPSAVVAQLPAPDSIRYEVRQSNQRIEMVVNTSRILTLGTAIPQAQVNDPEVVALTPLSKNEVQISAKKRGVTQVNLWNEDKQIFSLDVIVFADARELTELLRSQFPSAALKVVPTATSVIISGFVDDPVHVSRIVEIAEDYYPKVINHINVGGVQQVSLHTKVMEVSRTKLRRMGVDWLWGDSSGSFVANGIGGVLQMSAATAGLVSTSGGETFSYGVVDGGGSFFMFLEALKQNDLAKVLADPTLTTVSGRPAFFNSGGEFPILVPQSLGTVSIQYRKYGTQIDFVPIVLGNGAIRLEVRPRVSEIDDSRSVIINNTAVPGLRVREVDTAVEMRPGQTLALAGLVQTRVEGRTRGLPYLSDVPVLGTVFRKVEEETNEIELLILVTPQLVEAVDQHMISPCGPGTDTISPTDCELYFGGHIEVPAEGIESVYSPLGGCLGQPGCPCPQCVPQGMPGGVSDGVPYSYPSYGPEPVPALQAPPGPAPVERLPPVDSGSMPQANSGVPLVSASPGASRVYTTGPAVRAADRNTSQGRYSPSNPSRITGGAVGEGEQSGQFIGPLGYDALE